MGFSSLIYHFNFAGGLEFREVQFTSSHSPTRYPLMLAPLIIGLSSGKSMTWIEFRKLHFILQKNKSRLSDSLQTFMSHIMSTYLFPFVLLFLGQQNNLSTLRVRKVAFFKSIETAKH